MNDSPSGLLLGCIADDFTGATDLANNLVRAGMRVVQTIGVPDGSRCRDADAVVVALKSRTMPAADAVAQSLAALRWLRAQGCAPVLLQGLLHLRFHAAGQHRPGGRGADGRAGRATSCCVTPAFPENARTVYKGHLFVGDVLLSESGMRHHPLTPMTDANLVRVLQAQSRGPGRADRRTRWCAAARRRSARASRRCAPRACRFAHRRRGRRRRPACTLGRALRRRAAGRRRLRRGHRPPAEPRPAPSTAAAALPPRARRCAPSSRAAARRRPTRRWRPSSPPAAPPSRSTRCALAAGDDVVGAALAWATPRLGAAPAAGLRHRRRRTRCAAVQQQLGAGDAGALVEDALAAIARGPGGARRAAAGGRRRRNLGRGACRRWACGSCASARRSIPGVPWCHAAATACGARRAPGAEVGQLRQRRLLHAGLRPPRMNEDAGPRRDLPRRPLPVRARLRARHRRQHQRAAGRRLPDHAHRRLPGLPASPRAGAAWTLQGRQLAGDARQQDPGAAPAHLRGAARSAQRRAA